MAARTLLPLIPVSRTETTRTGSGVHSCALRLPSASHRVAEPQEADNSRAHGEKKKARFIKGREARSSIQLAALLMKGFLLRRATQPFSPGMREKKRFVRRSPLPSGGPHGTKRGGVPPQPPRKRLTAFADN